MVENGGALAEGLFWMAEKLMWGYQGVERDPPEAFKLYQQAAKLGLSDCLIRVGQLQEFGKGTEHDPTAALRSYHAAARAGNFLAFAFLGKLLSRSSHLEEANAMWDRFFAALAANPEPGFLAASRGELLHDYIRTQLTLGLDPGHRGILQLHRSDVVSHHQQLLEHTSDEHLGRLRGISNWIKQNLSSAE